MTARCTGSQSKRDRAGAKAAAGRSGLSSRTYEAMVRGFTSSWWGDAHPRSYTIASPPCARHVTALTRPPAPRCVVALVDARVGQQVLPAADRLGLGAAQELRDRGELLVI